MKTISPIAAPIIVLLFTLGGCVGSGSMYETTGGGIVVSGGAAASSGGSGGVSSGTVIATGGAIAGDRPRDIEGCHVSPGESWLKCQTTADGTPRTNPAPAAEMPAMDPRPGDFSNIPGVQEVHWVASGNHCRDLAEKLNMKYLFFPLNPGSSAEGNCKLIGDRATDDRFTDRRYDKDN